MPFDNHPNRGDDNLQGRKKQKCFHLLSSARFFFNPECCMCNASHTATVSGQDLSGLISMTYAQKKKKNQNVFVQKFI